jgi:hypothetical protein
LDGASLTVTSDVAHQDEEEPLKEGVPIEQSDKPRAGSKHKTWGGIFCGFLTGITVAAEYLAKGYVLSDNILQQAIDMDSKG